MQLYDDWIQITLLEIRTNNIKNIVAFCILMQSKEGIIGKSPDYILEKFEHYLGKKSLLNLKDSEIKNVNPDIDILFNNYINTWKIRFK